MEIIPFFIDPLLRAPFLGSIFICLVASLVGVTLFVKKRTLLAETLSHATYPGVVFGTILSLSLGLSYAQSYVVLGAGVLSSLIGLGLIHFMIKKARVYIDSTFTFILSTFFALGIVISSYVQFTLPAFFQIVRSYIYGQAAALVDQDIYIYGSFAFIVVIAIVLLYKELHLFLFDETFSKFALKKASLFAFYLFVTISAAVVIAMRSVGVVLISGMLIAPALAARQYTHRLSTMFLLAALFGGCSAFLGNLASYYFSKRMTLSLPTGPMIVVIAQLFAFASLLFAPKQGQLMRYMRICSFRFKCMQENLVKTLWYQPGFSAEEATLRAKMGSSRVVLFFLLFRCRQKGWISGSALTPAGQQLGKNIVRLHRLWELYLVEDLGVQKNQVHKSAEEMEHILTPELEQKITQYLKDPLFDPHNQPIPSNKEVTSYG